jgi:hypothetical protein
MCTPCERCVECGLCAAYIIRIFLYRKKIAVVYSENSHWRHFCGSDVPHGQNTVASLFKTSCLMKKPLSGPNLNKTCKQFTHFPSYDFDSVWCAVLLMAKQRDLPQENFGLPGTCETHFLPWKALLRLANTLISTQDKHALRANNSDRTKYV